MVSAYETIMLHKSHNFIYHFLILFLAVLLVMFGMYYALLEYSDYVKRESPRVSVDVGHLFKVNLFIIDLCLLMIIETLLILLFYKYTLSSMSVASVLLILFLMASNKWETRRAIVGALTPFISNKTASLDMADALILIIVNTLLLSLLVTVLLKEVEREDLLAAKTASSDTNSPKGEKRGGEKGDNAYLPPGPS